MSSTISFVCKKKEKKKETFMNFWTPDFIPDSIKNISVLLSDKCFNRFVSDSWLEKIYFIFVQISLLRHHDMSCLDRKDPQTTCHNKSSIEDEGLTLEVDSKFCSILL